MDEYPNQTRLYDMGHGLGGTAFWFCILARLVRSSRWTGYVGGIDDTCEIVCACDEKFSASEDHISWCPKCGRGYSTVFETYCYPRWLERIRKYAVIQRDPKVTAMLEQFKKEREDEWHKKFMESIQPKP